ncbi:MAG: hopanoid biosynthesis-associated protein HpnK [Verrucomicrobiota bacterium]
MGRVKPRRLIINADDFGRSHSINEAVILAHQDGILTSASLMVNESDCAEAVALARQNPELGVGLHLSLVCGHSALPRQTIPGLVDSKNQFSNNAVAAGFRFFFLRKLKAQLFEEIDAQFKKFQATGLHLDHVNGHLNIHLHPVVFNLLMQNAQRWNIRHLRLTSDPIVLNFHLAKGNSFYRIIHGLVYKALSSWARPTLQRRNIRHTQAVFGLLQNAHVEEDFILRLLSHLPSGDSELYSHPSLHEFGNEFAALLSPKVKEAVEKCGIELIRYQDLT